MLSDIVIDTNVLRHCDNPEQQLYTAAMELILAMFDCPTLMCVDDQGLIETEYEENLSFEDGLGGALIVHLVDQDRLRRLPPRVSDQARRAINALCRDPRDRTFARVALNTKDRLLASHDRRAFGQRNKRELRRRVGIDCVDASEAMSRLL